VKGDAFEAEIRKRCENGDFRGASEAAVRGYGPEILGFLTAVMGSEPDAGEVFSQFAEGLWRDLPRFEWKSTLRTWSYAVAKNAMRAWKAKVHRDPKRHAQESALADVAEQVRSATLPWLRTENKNKLQQLRDELSADDRLLLVLRVDRELAWDEIALVTLDDDAASEDAVKKESARLRKRFQLVKDELRNRAREAGLLPGET
jgi:RNA polymerase sigma-70 factor (ECF subfamily)